MVVVLAIIAIIAAASLPVLIRQIDYATQGNEATNLLALATSLQQGAMRWRHIPSQYNWATFTAANAGWQLNAVQNNSRSNPRVFLIDPSLVIGAVTATTLPYTNNGAGTIPNNPRFIIMTSLAGPLPSSITDGVPSTANFNALWANPDDTVPSGTTWDWSTYKGQGADLKIQRINLATSFSQLILSVADPTNALYSIDTFGISSIPSGASFTNWFLSGTVYKLYATSATATNLAASQVLREDTSWVYESGGWRNAKVPAPAPVASGGGSWGQILDEFLKCKTNHGVSPMMIYTDMTNVMGLYNQYAAGGFTNNTLKSSVANATTIFMNHYQSIDTGPWAP